VAAPKTGTGAERRCVTSPGLQLSAPYHRFGRMPSPPRDKPKPTKPEAEGEFPDAWERFERAFDTVMKAKPEPRSSKPKERLASKGRVHKGSR
jgi:hypothetical protein